MFNQQSEFAIRCEWGAAGLCAPALISVVVVVDVLAFSTCVDVAVSYGAAIYPCRWRDERAAGLAQEASASVLLGVTTW
ncbi:MAG TPA: hypothetical protein PLC98_24535 [Anaerolineales bacterium]|nr:hypothetical protein [Anaerolineales bacterium]